MPDFFAAGLGSLRRGPKPRTEGAPVAAVRQLENGWDGRESSLPERLGSPSLQPISRKSARTDAANAILPSGIVFTVIGNPSRKPISGNLANLTDGRTITVGSNTFQANYEGGDGNDLTLTVVP